MGQKEIKIVTIVGARPQFVKAAVVNRAIRDVNSCQYGDKHRIREVIVHTGQHFDRNMSDVFFSELQIPEVDYNLGINRLRHGAMTGRMLEEIEEVLVKEEPDWVMVLGDTNSTLAGALAAAKLNIPVAHVEAGLRSFNRRMPEEINRILTDRISDLLLCPTENAVQNLEEEGFCNILGNGELIEEYPCETTLSSGWSVAANVGDVMYDSALYNRAHALAQSTIMEKLALDDGGLRTPFCLATVHREENTDDMERFGEIVEVLTALSDKLPVIWPLHPRSKARIGKLNPSSLREGSRVRIVDPMPYLDMIVLEEAAELIITDSGGVQKEAFFFETPCITIRDETEWVELAELGVNAVVGVNKEAVLQAFESFRGRKVVFQKGLYGNGAAGQAIVRLLLQLGTGKNAFN
jgi:UDP-GlcNAc3NAcA epimerase